MNIESVQLNLLDGWMRRNLLLDVEISLKISRSLFRPNTTEHKVQTTMSGWMDGWISVLSIFLVFPDLLFLCVSEYTQKCTVDVPNLSLRL